MRGHTQQEAAEISIHALRGEGDTINGKKINAVTKFLSTPSVGRATDAFAGVAMYNILFLSTPSVGRATLCTQCVSTERRYFYPRPPWGGRQSVPFRR